MELSVEKLLADLQSRDQHILKLQQQLLRVDYQYSQIIKQLRQKYTILSTNYKMQRQQLTFLKRQNRKICQLLSKKDRQRQKTLSKVQDWKVQAQNLEVQLRTLSQNYKSLEITKKSLVSENRKLVEESKELRGELKRVKERLREEGETRRVLEKRVMEVQEVLRGEVRESQERVKQIQREIQNRDNKNNHIVEEQLKDNERIDSVEKMRTVEVSDWELDMKKLKNCIDYGENYIIMFDPTHLDRCISRQIFNYIKKLHQQNQTLTNQFKTLTQNHKILTQQSLLQYQTLQQKLLDLTQCQSPVPLIDSSTQTQPPQNQKTLDHLMHLNTQLKIKNMTLCQCIQVLGLKYVVMENYLSNCFISLGYQKKIVKKLKSQMSKSQEKQDSEGQNKRGKILKKVMTSVLFVCCLKKLSKTKKAYLKQYKDSASPSTLPNPLKLYGDFCLLEKSKICNPQLQKLKETLLISEQNTSLYEIVTEIVRYYQFKFGSVYGKNNIIKDYL